MGAVELTRGDLLQAEVLTYHHVWSIVRPMALKFAVELGIPDIIHSHGGPMALSELQAALHLDGQHKGHALHRLMRLLVHMGCFRCQDSGVREVAYGLTAFSTLLLKGGQNSASPFLLYLLTPPAASMWDRLGAWLMGDQPTPFHMVFGKSVWDVAAEDPAVSHRVNGMMAVDSGLLVEALVGPSGDVFHGLQSLVDVGGGTGSTATAITAAFPSLKCTVFDLPHVVASAPAASNVEFVGGDMFDHVPQADAVLLKCVLHDWSDADCVKILKKCKEAILPKQGGKVIVIDIVLNSKKDDAKHTEAQYLFDIAMMVIAGGKEREEHEWEKLFVAAGYTDYKIKHQLGLRSIIEVYP